MPQMFPVNWLLPSYLIMSLYLTVLIMMFFSYTPHTPMTFHYQQNYPTTWLW